MRQGRKSGTEAAFAPAPAEVMKEVGGHRRPFFYTHAPCDKSSLDGPVNKNTFIGMKTLVKNLSASVVLALVAGGSAVFAPSASADQFDPMLDGYFAALAEANNMTEIKVIEQQIWDTWRQTDQNAAGDIFRDGMEAMQAADFAEAITLFTDAIALDSDFAEAYNMRATTYFLMGRYFESLTDVQVTIDLEPRHFGALMGGAQIAIRSGQAELALEFVEAALKVSPNNPEWQAIANHLRDVTGAIDL